MNPFKPLLAAVMGVAAAGPAMAQSATAPSATMSMAPAAATSASPSSDAFRAADQKMMKAMDTPMTGNADQDFVSGMLPHHEGAVDMAKVELKFGKDPEMVRLAREIVAAQQKEIAQMRLWQARHPQH